MRASSDGERHREPHCLRLKIPPAELLTIKAPHEQCSLAGARSQLSARAEPHMQEWQLAAKFVHDRPIQDQASLYIAHFVAHVLPLALLRL